MITPEGDPRVSAHQRPNPVTRVYRHSCYSLLLSLCRPNGGEKKNLATGSTDHLRSTAQANAPPRPSQRMGIVLFLGCCLLPAGRGFWDMSRFHRHGTYWLQLYHITPKVADVTYFGAYGRGICHTRLHILPRAARVKHFPLPWETGHAKVRGSR